MYKIILLLISFSSFAQLYSGSEVFDASVLDKYSAIEQEFEQSDFINDFIANFERSRMVSCKGEAKIRYPYIHNRLIYKAQCSGADKIVKVRLKVKYYERDKENYKIVKRKITIVR